MKIEGAQDRSPVSLVPIRLKHSRGEPAGPDKQGLKGVPKTLYVNSAVKKEIAKRKSGHLPAGFLHFASKTRSYKSG